MTFAQLLTRVLQALRRLLRLLKPPRRVHPAMLRTKQPVWEWIPGPGCYYARLSEN